MNESEQMYEATQRNPESPQTSEEFQRTDEAHARVAEALERKAEAQPLVQARPIEIHSDCHRCKEVRALADDLRLEAVKAARDLAAGRLHLAGNVKEAVTAERERCAKHLEWTLDMNCPALGWRDAIGEALEKIRSGEYLTPAQARILYGLNPEPPR